ncbi:hypothetical protein [Nostoc sp. PA-18-2419]|uniref:hypothetical protein n=1 Tax=Nostoc sp. PA-18-2419 TaxID=2575443 RepID=UPI001673909A|nr:hypothetical protein [Nostoc sp. PA-18-2419]
MRPQFSTLVSQVFYGQRSQKRLIKADTTQNPQLAKAIASANKTKVTLFFILQ